MMKYWETKQSHGKDPYIKYWLENLKEISLLRHRHDDDDIKMDVKRHQL
jgi:hypothetical protein